MEFSFEKRINQIANILDRADSKFRRTRKVPKENWAVYYCKYLKKSGIDMVVGVRIPMENLRMLLEEARKFYYTENPQVTLNEYVADFLFTSLNPQIDYL